MIYHKFEQIEEFDWKDLHKKFVQIIVAEPHVDTLELTGQVWACDIENHKIYLIKEWSINP